MGAQPSKATVRLNSVDRLTAQIVIDSGSNISLVSTKLLDKLNPKPKIKEGQNIKISQVTSCASTTQYLPLEMFFESNWKFISLKIKAYIVKDMNAPLILGNDFADQYSLLILQDNGCA